MASHSPHGRGVAYVSALTGDSAPRPRIRKDLWGDAQQVRLQAAARCELGAISAFGSTMLRRSGEESVTGFSPTAAVPRGSPPYPQAGGLASSVAQGLDGDRPGIDSSQDRLDEVVLGQELKQLLSHRVWRPLDDVTVPLLHPAGDDLLPTFLR
jgi:hypothetical protein